MTEIQYFISDLHLSPDQPDTTRALVEFLQGPAQDASQLYILGDLFEYWAGDDDENALADTVAGALTAFAACTGKPACFMAGNRDFLLGPAYAARAGLSLLSDPSPVRLPDGHIALLSHGDTLCTDDDAYLRYRAVVRNPVWQAEFLAKPLAERRAFIEGLRARSEASKQEKSAEIMDVNPDAVVRCFGEHDVPVLIHGHTHRPAHHTLMAGGRECHRWVLPDWHGQAVYLRADAEGLAFCGPVTPAC